MFDFLRRRRASPRRYVFICTYGRSGSTLLMGLINTIPHYRIRGENNNTLYPLFESWKALCNAKANGARNSERSTHPWYGLHQVQPERFAAALRDAFVENVLMPGPEDTVTGCKEIRFSEKEVPDFDGYIVFLRTVFAPARIIFNHRNLDDVAASEWWSNMPKAREKLTFMEERFRAVPAAGDVFHFDYDRLVGGGAQNHIGELFTFLGESSDPAAVDAVLGVRHSY
jgi:hypothetical protein